MVSEVEPKLETAAAIPSGSGSISPQAVSLPSGPATSLGMGESFSTQLSTGVATPNIPLTIPSTRGGVQPNLSLSYNSAGGFGVAGMGWSVGASAITRQSDRGIPKYEDLGRRGLTKGTVLRNCIPDMIMQLGRRGRSCVIAFQI